MHQIGNQRRRSKMEMNLDILKAIHMGEFKPTRIMSRCNMTWAQLQDGLELLMRSGFIEVESLGKTPMRRVDRRTKKKYYLTLKGESVIRYFRKELDQVKVLISDL